METDPLDAQSALDAAEAAERRSAEIATSTPWYAPWYGITCAAVPVAFALIACGQKALAIAVVMVLLASLLTLMTTYQHVTGVWPSVRIAGWFVFIEATVVMVGASALCYLVASSDGLGWWLAAVAVATAVLMALLSRSYDAAIVRKHGAR